MAVKEDHREYESWWDRVARGLVVDFATTIAALYAVGLLIVNLDLSRYNVVAVDLARPEYVMVGLLWAILVTLTISVIWFIAWFFNEKMRPIARSQYFEAIGRSALLSVVIAAVFALALYVLVLVVVCDGDLNDIFHFWFWNLVEGLLMQALLAFVIVGVFVLFDPLVRGERKSVLVPVSPSPAASESSRILALFIAIGTSVSFGLLGLFSYTRFVFAQVPREWGGGRKPVVELFLTEKLPVFAERNDIPSTTDGKRIGPVVCLLETERVLIIVSLNYPYLSNKGGETFAVDRKFVAAVAYEGSYSPSPTSSAPPSASPNPTSSPPVTH